MKEGSSGNGSVFEIAAQRRTSFEEKYERGKVSERARLTEDGQEITYVAYDVALRPDSDASVKGIARFVLESLQAGYVEAASPLVMPTFDGARSSDGEIETVSSVLFFFQKPDSRSSQKPTSTNR